MRLFKPRSVTSPRRITFFFPLSLHLIFIAEIWQVQVWKALNRWSVPAQGFAWLFSFQISFQNTLHDMKLPSTLITFFRRNKPFLSTAIAYRLHDTKSVIVCWYNITFPGCVMLQGIEKLPCSSPVNFGKHNSTSSARIRSHCRTLPLKASLQLKSTEEPAVSLELLLLKRRNHWFENGDEWVVLYFRCCF